MKLFLRTLLLCLLLGTLSVRAQLSCGLKGGVGLSQITGYSRGENSKYRVLPSPSLSLGGYGQLGMGSKFLLRAELLGSLITDHYRLKYYYTDDNGTPTKEFGIYHIWRNVGYLSVPVMFGWKTNRFSFFLGAQASFSLKSWARDKGWAPLGDSIVHYQNKYISMNVQPFDVGPKAAATFSLTDRFSLEMSYYHGLMAIQEAPNYPWPFRVRQLLVGVQWQLNRKQSEQ